MRELVRTPNAARWFGVVALIAVAVLLFSCTTISHPLVATASPSDSPKATNTAKRGTLEWYLAQMPMFPTAPIPVKLKVPDSDRAIAWDSIPTNQKVAFITIDDGQFQDPLWSDFIRDANIPVTSFLTYYFVWHSGDYFLKIHPGGRGIHNHSKNHVDLTTLSYSAQKNQLCLADDWLTGLYGRRPQLFRPPYGHYNDDTLKAARACGHGLAILWTQSVSAGILTSNTNKPLQSGDIILLHYQKTLPQDLIVAVQAIHLAGLVPALLDDYIDLPES